MNCGTTYSVTVLQIQKTVAEHVVLQLISKCIN